MPAPPESCGAERTTPPSTSAARLCLPLAVCVLGIAACHQDKAVPTGVVCDTGQFSISDQYPGARRGPCKINSIDAVSLRIQPEDSGRINDSAWYAFRVTADTPGELSVRIDYDGGTHRYWPKISTDLENWSKADAAIVEESADNRHVTIRLPVSESPVWVAAQPIVLPRHYTAWVDRMTEIDDLESEVLGYSTHQNPISVLIHDSPSDDVVFLIGRQHPPEVTGAFAYFGFIETLFSDSDLARRFRARFDVVTIPILNPDGVTLGHWRHNVRGIDLNRDWGPFLERETRLVRDMLDDFDESGRRIRFFLDFHSTKRNVFYTHNDEFPTEPEGLVHDWLSDAAHQVGNYEFSNEQGPVTDQANSKNYMYRRYGIPAATYEVGDATEESAAADAASVFANVMMEHMLLKMPDRGGQTDRQGMLDAVSQQ